MPVFKGVDVLKIYRVFNMGTEMVVFCSLEDAGEFTSSVSEAGFISEVVRQGRADRVIVA